MTVATATAPQKSSAAKLPHVTVCICTYRRPAMLERLLHRLEGQETRDAFTYSVVVADNDGQRSAEPLVTAFVERSPLEVLYCHEPRQNIALARNCAINHARGDYIAFIDDDEFPTDDWLLRLMDACHVYDAAGILGPVRPHFESPPPAWILKGRFCDRPEPATGTVLEGKKCRTGNVLFRRSILKGSTEPFRAQFGTGGEDVDFFHRMTSEGGVFVWCNEAVAYETVPPSRWTRRYMLQRALLRGRNNVKLSHGRAILIATSMVAFPLYSLILPFTALFGHHHFMKYTIRCCDHLGRLLAAIGLNPVSTRNM